MGTLCSDYTNPIDVHNRRITAQFAVSFDLKMPGLEHDVSVEHAVRIGLHVGGAYKISQHEEQVRRLRGSQCRLWLRCPR
jgi:hypothetical protein